jgi:hypothetical protein
MKNLKFKVSTPEESREIQELLFQLGYEWIHHRRKVKYTDKPYLFAKSNTNRKIITWDSCTEHFKTESEHLKCSVLDLQKMVNQLNQVESLESLDLIEIV